MNNEPRHEIRQRVTFGLLLVGIGALFLLERSDLLEIESLWHYWPLLLVLIGIGKAAGGRAEDIFSGIWTAMVGFWLFATFEHLWGLNFRTSWPFMLIAWGIIHIAKPHVKDLGEQAEHKN